MCVCVCVYTSKVGFLFKVLNVWDWLALLMAEAREHFSHLRKKASTPCVRRHGCLHFLHTVCLPVFFVGYGEWAFERHLIGFWRALIYLDYDMCLLCPVYYYIIIYIYIY
ncbi:hypothetical protein BD289DRAFT_442816 [Coniella lustricola]|uniref:Uncharacterized protein n=1 Tax=Coniella lustricola TaxID=2025994 RepID=A0A2T2ZXV7_9PEZI|nr:hypothetical protein BD289DRAFT_442816 [Coniella lustricola]